MNADQMAEKHKTDTVLNFFGNDLKELKSDVKDVKRILQKDYVTKELFDIRVGRLEKIVYSIVSVVGLAVLTALLAQVII